MTETLIFISLASLLCFCSIMMITRKNPVASAVYLIGTLFLVAATYAFLGADFVAAIQVLVYAGAIMVLFVFVIMLLNLSPDQFASPRISAGEVAVMVITIIAFGAVGFFVLNGNSVGIEGPYTLEVINQAGGNTNAIGLKLFSDYVWPFELASFLILLAIVASVLIAKKDRRVKTDLPGGSN